MTIRVEQTLYEKDIASLNRMFFAPDPRRKGNPLKYLRPASEGLYEVPGDLNYVEKVERASWLFFSAMVTGTFVTFCCASMLFMHYTKQLMLQDDAATVPKVYYDQQGRARQPL